MRLRSGYAEAGTCPLLDAPIDDGRSDAPRSEAPGPEKAQVLSSHALPAGTAGDVTSTVRRGGEHHGTLRTQHLDERHRPPVPTVSEQRTHWIAIIHTCGLEPLSYGQVNNGIFPLTEAGKAGGKVHGQVDVPPGCCIVLAVATCKNVYTDMAMVQAGCDQTACLNLITKRLCTCAG